MITNEPTIGITTILLVVMKAVEGAVSTTKKPPKKQVWVFILWHDGPSFETVKILKDIPYLMQEYHAASTRGNMDCRCTYCDINGCLTESDREIHCEWHDKFRKFVELRLKKYPNMRDYNATKKWKPASEAVVLRELVEMWYQVDPTAPYFLTAKFADEHRLSIVAAAKAAKSAAAKEKRKAAKAAAIAAERSDHASSVPAKDDSDVIEEPVAAARRRRLALGMRFPREMKQRQ